MGANEISSQHPDRPDYKFTTHARQGEGPEELSRRHQIRLYRHCRSNVRKRLIKKAFLKPAYSVLDVLPYFLILVGYWTGISEFRGLGILWVITSISFSLGCSFYRYKTSISRKMAKIGNSWLGKQ